MRPTGPRPTTASNRPSSGRCATRRRLVQQARRLVLPLGVRLDADRARRRRARPRARRSAARRLRDALALLVDYLLVTYVLLREGLPMPEFVNDVSLVWLRPLREMSRGAVAASAPRAPVRGAELRAFEDRDRCQRLVRQRTAGADLHARPGAAHAAAGRAAGARSARPHAAATTCARSCTSSGRRTQEVFAGAARGAARSRHAAQGVAPGDAGVQRAGERRARSAACCRCCGTRARPASASASRCRCASSRASTSARARSASCAA